MITIYHLNHEIDRDIRMAVESPMTVAMREALDLYGATTAPDDERQAAAKRFLSLKEEAVRTGALSAWKAGHYVKMATVEGEDLEQAYRLTQNGVVTRSWTLEPPDGLVPYAAPVSHEGRLYGNRSTSMGDILMVGDALHVVADVGFQRIDA